VPPPRSGAYFELNSHTAHKVRPFVCCPFGADSAPAGEGPQDLAAGFKLKGR
jgi:hypothetical protein